MFVWVRRQRGSRLRSSGYLLGLRYGDRPPRRGTDKRLTSSFPSWSHELHVLVQVYACTPLYTYVHTYDPRLSGILGSTVNFENNRENNKQFLYLSARHQETNGYAAFQQAWLASCREESLHTHRATNQTKTKREQVLTVDLPKTRAPVEATSR